MNRRVFQLLMVMLGVVIGTTAAMLRIKVGRVMSDRDAATAKLDPKDPAGEISTEVTDAKFDQDAQPTRDPGNRRSLAELRQAAMLEPNWTRSFELTERSGQKVRSEDLNSMSPSAEVTSRTKEPSLTAILACRRRRLNRRCGLRH